MWSRIGGGKNACAGLPLRLVLKGETFSPLYWKSKHQALIDMQRQCGYPSLFKTMASWEYSFPYHLFVLDEMEKGGRGRMQLAGLETLHTAHVFTQLNRGLYSGRNKTSAQDGWKDHILSADSVPEERRPQTVVNCLEFQHEKRKLPTQDYHGSGRVHSLDYVENVDQVGLERKLAATVPDAEDQPALQGTWKADRTVAATVAGRWRTDKAQGHRAFFPETLEITTIRTYVATYTPKFSDSFAREWLNDEASAFSVARRVLFDYQPAEPEMWLYLFAQCRYGGTMVPLIMPWPGMETPAAVVKAYEDSSWRCENMSLLEFCRKTNSDGQIAKWVVKLHKLHAFANNCPTRGEKLVACDMLSVFNDRWFGQWLALRKPFQQLNGLLSKEVQEKVPLQYAHFANAVLQCPDYWDDEDRVRADLQLEATGNDKILTFLAKVKAQRALVEKFMNGLLTKEDEERLERSICKLLDAAKAAREAPNEAAWEHIVDEAAANSRPQAVIGPPGTGKTTVIDKCVRRCLRQGGRVLFALPTAQQASRVRTKHPEADVDTCAGAFFLYKDSVEVMDCLTQYDMIAVDEVSQLSQKDFDRIVQMYLLWSSPVTSGSSRIELWRCKDETLRQKLVALRTAMPTKQLLKRIALRHKAWSGHREPTAWDLQELYRKVPHTTIATCGLGVQRFDDENKVVLGRPPVPLRMKLHRGLRVHLTRNVDKPADFVNGMEATVSSYDPCSRCVHVVTKTWRNLAVYPITDWVEGCGYVTAHPMRPGYASTVHKLQGAELEHVTIWLDIPYMKAAGYVALSRVQRDSDYLLGGIVTRKHFLPAM
ncbi:Pif1 [Symbiodinium pilosum]|uniref:Pif1 protein n=1 Tax=Symbiodinium pilosum TaxID=2952 RepID=A0A812SFF3_SYMPI|nr:Pif1 [Symbiodinium pilosum]